MKDRVLAANAPTLAVARDNYLSRLGVKKGQAVNVTYGDDDHAVIHTSGGDFKVKWSRFSDDPPADGTFVVTDPKRVPNKTRAVQGAGAQVRDRVRADGGTGTAVTADNFLNRHGIPADTEVSVSYLNDDFASVQRDDGPPLKVRWSRFRDPVPAAEQSDVEQRPVADTDAAIDGLRPTFLTEGTAVPDSRVNDLARSWRSAYFTATPDALNAVGPDVIVEVDGDHDHHYMYSSQKKRWVRIHNGSNMVDSDTDYVDSVAGKRVAAVTYHEPPFRSYLFDLTTGSMEWSPLPAGHPDGEWGDQLVLPADHPRIAEAVAAAAFRADSDFVTGSLLPSLRSGMTRPHQGGKNTWRANLYMSVLTEQSAKTLDDIYNGADTTKMRFDPATKSWTPDPAGVDVARSDVLFAELTDGGARVYTPMSVAEAAGQVKLPDYTVANDATQPWELRVAALAAQRQVVLDALPPGDSGQWFSGATEPHGLIDRVARSQRHGTIVDGHAATQLSVGTQIQTIGDPTPMRLEVAGGGKFLWVGKNGNTEPLPPFEIPPDLRHTTFEVVGSYDDATVEDLPLRERESIRSLHLVEGYGEALRTVVSARIEAKGGVDANNYTDGRSLDAIVELLGDRVPTATVPTVRRNVPWSEVAALPAGTQFRQSMDGTEVLYETTNDPTKVKVLVNGAGTVAANPDLIDTAGFNVGSGYDVYPPPSVDGPLSLDMAPVKAGKVRAVQLGPKETQAVIDTDNGDYIVTLTDYGKTLTVINNGTIYGAVGAGPADISRVAVGVKADLAAAADRPNIPAEAWTETLHALGMDTGADQHIPVAVAPPLSQGEDAWLLTKPKPVKDLAPGSDARTTVEIGLAPYPATWTAGLRNRPQVFSIRHHSDEYGGWNRNMNGRNLLRIPSLTERPWTRAIVSHEFGHTFEATIPGLLKAEMYHLADRVAADPKQRTWSWPGGIVGYKNGFGEEYSGRLYGHALEDYQTHYELFTTGVETIVHHRNPRQPKRWYSDNRLTAFTAGVITLFTPPPLVANPETGVPATPELLAPTTDGGAAAAAGVSP